MTVTIDSPTMLHDYCPSWCEATSHDLDGLRRGDGSEHFRSVGGPDGVFVYLTRTEGQVRRVDWTEGSHERGLVEVSLDVDSTLPLDDGFTLPSVILTTSAARSLAAALVRAADAAEAH